MFSGCFLFVCWVLFATMLGSWVIGRENGRTVVSEKIENILIASYLMEEFIFSGIFRQCICIALQLSWFVKASCAVSGLYSLKEKNKMHLLISTNESLLVRNGSAF